MLSSIREAFRKPYCTAYTMACNFYHSYKPIIVTDRESTIMVLGSARSGTTWTGNVIAGMLNAREIFEPFILHKAGYFYFTANNNRDVKDCNRNYQLYIRPDSPRNNYTDQIEAVLVKHPRSFWCNRGCDPGFYPRKLIKDIRANLFMAYIAHSRPDIKIIWIVRNPVEVIESQVAMAQTGADFDWHVDQIKTQPELLEDWLSPFLTEMEAAQSLPERLSHRWCIETFVPRKQNIVDYPNVLLVRYEDLIGGPEEWNPVRDFLGCKTWDTDQLKCLLPKPARTSRKLNADGRKQNNCLSETDIAHISRIVNIYGLEM